MISEEKVREILKGAADLLELKVTDNSVEFLDDSKPPIRYFVTSTEISYEPHNEPKCRNTFTVREYQNTYGEIPEINTVLPKIAALLSPQTETERLEERVRELEAKLRDERESYLQCSSVEGQKREALDNRVAELEDQLDNAISNADHEVEMEKWESAFEIVQKERDEARKERDVYRQWFEREYALNRPVLDLSEGRLHV